MTPTTKSRAPARHIQIPTMSHDDVEPHTAAVGWLLIAKGERA